MSDETPTQPAALLQNVYAAPGATASPGRRVLPAWKVSARRALQVFGLGIASFAATLLLTPHLPGRTRESVGFAISTGFFALGVVWAMVALRRMWRVIPGVPGGWRVLVILFPLLTGAVFSFFGTILTVFATGNFVRGRQLRRRGQVLLPPVHSGDDWASLAFQTTVDPAVRPALAAQWRQNGRTEHASVAAFARLTLDLMALGAPPKLLAAANRDALDEMRHTELCFSLAQALDGVSESPGPFPAAQHAGGLLSSRALALSQLAVSSLIDGALHEGLSARVIARLVKRCEEPAIREVLRELAADEGRHAAHGWDIVEWCLDQGGELVAHALRGALTRLPDGIDPEHPADARGGGWERYGIHGMALEAEEYGKAKADVTQRVLSITREFRRAA